MARRIRPGRPGASRGAWRGRSGRAWCRRWRTVSSPGRRRCPAWRPRWCPGPRWRWSPARPAASAPDWPGSCGKTQLAVGLAESVWQSRAVDLLAWVTATSRASVLSGYAQAAAELGLDHERDAEAVAARFLAWLDGTTRPWLVVLDDLRDAADLDGLWPAGPAGRVLITAADAGAVPGEHGVLVCRGARVQHPGGAELPVGPADHRPGPAQRRDRPGRRTGLRAGRAGPGRPR